MLEAIAKKQSKGNKKYNEEWLKTFKGFEGYSDEEALRTLNELQLLADILCSSFKNTS